ncbi:MAG: mechanosensitive ion channel family protein [Actinomycetes bacterium]
MHTSAPLAVDFGQGISDAWSNVATFVPKLVAFLVILLITWIVAKVLQKVVDAVLEKVNFDRAVERGGIKKAMSRSKYDASDLVGKLVYYAVWLFGLSAAFHVWGDNPISQLLQNVIEFLPKVFVAIVIVVVAAAIANAVKSLITDMIGGLSYGKFLANAAMVFIWGIGIIAALNQIDVAVTVTEPILITVLAIIAGVTIVGVGGGLIQPMRQRWEQYLQQASQQTQQMKQHVQAKQGSSSAPSRPSSEGYSNYGTPGSTAANVDLRDSTQQMPATPEAGRYDGR